MPQRSLPVLRRVKIRTISPDLSRFPDFLIIGPQRTGTTWLYHNLRQHPNIFLTDVKETYYFSTLGQPDHVHYRFPYLEDYLELFRERLWRRIKKNYDALRKASCFYRPRVRGEATATYAALDEDTIRDITALNPDIKAILMLRDPLERAWSHAKKTLLRGSRSMEEISLHEFRDFFEREGQRKLADYRTINANWSAHLKPGHLFLGDYHRIHSTPQPFLDEIARFLEVPPRALRYNRHLREVINPTQEVAIPRRLKDYLEEHFAAERASYFDLLERTSQAPIH